MKDKLKKYLLPNLPYLFFVYLFDKLCQAVRLVPGLDASEKLLHIGQGFQTAFASSAPSFHALDICVGILGAILVRLAVYVKGKNAKKYRKGIEYGSARWGTAADIAHQLHFKAAAVQSLQDDLAQLAQNDLVHGMVSPCRFISPRSRRTAPA